MTTTPAPAAPAAAPATGSGTTFGTGTSAGMVTRRTSSRNATSSTTRPSSPNNNAQQQPSALQGQQPSSSTDLLSFTGYFQHGNLNTTNPQLSNNAGAHDDAEAAVQQFQFGQAPPQRGRLPGPAPAIRGPAAAGSATPITTPAQATNHTSNANTLIGAAFPPAGSSRSFVAGVQQRQADKQATTSRAGTQGQGSAAPQDASTVRPAVSRTPSLGTTLAGGPSPATSQERSANANATTTAQNVPPTTTRGDNGFLAPQGRSNSRNNTPSAISSAANPAAAPTAPTNTSNTAAKRTRSQAREGSEDESNDPSSSTARARKAAKVKVEGPESLIIGKQSRDLLDNIGAIATERDELKHTTESLTPKIEELEKAVATKEAELARVKRHTRDMLQKAQRSVKTAEEIKQDWAHQQASYGLAFEQLREEKNLLSDERKTLSEFLHGDGEGSLLSTKSTIESIHTEGLEAFRLVSKTLEHTRELLAKEKDNVKDAQFDRACERDRANDIATELQASVAKYELKSKEVAEMLKQVEELKAKRRVLEQRETDLLASKAEAHEKQQEQKAQLEAAAEREAKLRDKIEEIEKALSDKYKEIAELERRNEDIERRLASTETDLEAKQEEAEELEDTLEEQRKELKEQAKEIAKLTAEKEDLQLSLEDAHKNIESHQKSITALTEHRSEATNEIRELKQKVQTYEHEQSLRQRNEAQVDVLKTQLDEARNARSQAETELNHLRLDAVSKKYLLERAGDTERRLQETIEERKTREAKLRDDLDQRDAVIQSHEHQRQSLESQLAKSRDQADKYRSEAADVTKALNEEKHLRDKTRAECDSLKRELERVTEAQHRLEEERAKGMAALLGEQQRVRKLEQDLEAVTRGRATVVARYDSKQLEVWEIELLDHADSRRYVELREQLAEKDQLNRGLSDRLNSVNMEHAATKGQLDQSRKQCANLMRSLASAQAIINSGGQNLYDRGGADVGGVGPVRTGRVPSKTRPKKSTAQAATGGGTSMPTHLGHSYRSPSSTFRSSRMSRAPSSSDSERREASESRHQSKAAADDAERQTQQQDENQNQGLRARAPSPPSPHKNNGGGATAAPLAESQCPDDSGVMSSTIETTTKKTPRAAADDSQSMPPPTAAATYGRKTRRNDGAGTGGGTSAGGSIDDQVSSFLAADRAASSSGGGAGGAGSPSTTRKRGAGAGAGAATEFSMALGENLDDDSQDAQRVGSGSAAGSGRKKSEAMKGKRKAGGRA